MWREIFCILTATVGIIILDQILKYSGEKIDLLYKNGFKTEIDQLIDDGSTEVVPFIGHILTDILKEHDFFSAIGLDRKDVIIDLGDI